MQPVANMNTVPKRYLITSSMISSRAHMIMCTRRTVLYTLVQILSVTDVRVWWTNLRANKLVYEEQQGEQWNHFGRVGENVCM